MEEWLALRAQGIPTPAIVTWCNSPRAEYTDGHMTTWQWVLDHVYNNATRATLLWRRPSQPSSPAGGALKRTFFVPQNSLCVPRAISSACHRRTIAVGGLCVWVYRSNRWCFYVRAYIRFLCEPLCDLTTFFWTPFVSFPSSSFRWPDTALQFQCECQRAD
jgi:hypothetical protein